jgi:hypothetical protein
MSFPVKVTLAMAAVLLVGIGAVLLMSNPETTRIEEMLHQGAVWARAGNAEGCLGLLTSEESAEREEMAAQIRRHVRPDRHKDIEMRSVDVKVEGQEARAVVFLRAGANDALYPNADLRLEILLRREGDEWRITGYRLPSSAAEILR